MLDFATSNHHTIVLDVRKEIIFRNFLGKVTYPDWDFQPQDPAEGGRKERTHAWLQCWQAALLSPPLLSILKCPSFQTKLLWGCTLSFISSHPSGPVSSCSSSSVSRGIGSPSTSMLVADEARDPRRDMDGLENQLVYKKLGPDVPDWPKIWPIPTPELLAS